MPSEKESLLMIGVSVAKPHFVSRRLAMRLRRVEKFSKAVTKDLLPSQQATIAHVACGLLVARCMLLAEIARSLETTVKFTHTLKRVFRFADNPRLSARPDADDLSPELTSQMKVARRTIH